MHGLEKSFNGADDLSEFNLTSRCHFPMTMRQSFKPPAESEEPTLSFRESKVIYRNGAGLEVSIDSDYLREIGVGLKTETEIKMHETPFVRGFDPDDFKVIESDRDGKSRWQLENERQARLIQHQVQQILGMEQEGTKVLLRDSVDVVRDSIITESNQDFKIVSIQTHANEAVEYCAQTPCESRQQIKPESVPSICIPQSIPESPKPIEVKQKILKQFKHIRKNSGVQLPSNHKSPYQIKLSVKKIPKGLTLREFAKKEVKRIQQEELPIENIKWKTRRGSAEEVPDVGGRQTYREQGYFS